MANNRCPACHYSTRSRYHAIHCKGVSRATWAHAHTTRGTGAGTHKRTAGQIFASQRANAFPQIMPVNGRHEEEPQP